MTDNPKDGGPASVTVTQADMTAFHEAVEVFSTGAIRNLAKGLAVVIARHAAEARLEERECLLGGALLQFAERIFRAGHCEGWNGNQLRRDTQMIDVAKGWSLYVSNGAFAKSVEAIRQQPNTRQPGETDAN